MGSIFGPATVVSADADGAFEVPVLGVAAQPASASVPMSAKAAMPPERVIFTVFPSGMWVVLVDPGTGRERRYEHRVTSLGAVGERKVN